MWKIEDFLTKWEKVTAGSGSSGKGGSDATAAAAEQAISLILLSEVDAYRRCLPFLKTCVRCAAWGGLWRQAACVGAGHVLGQLWGSGGRVCMGAVDAYRRFLPFLKTCMWCAAGCGLWRQGAFVGTVVGQWRQGMYALREKGVEQSKMP